MGFKPRYLITHDYGGTPANRDGMHNPYNALVFPDGAVRYRNPADPYGVTAPHAYRMNPYSVGLSYAGEVGARPTEAGMATLRREYDAIRQRHPGIQMMGHGEAFGHFGHGHAMQASEHGRSLQEASWRSALGGGDGSALPVSARSITAFAGMPRPAYQQQAETQEQSSDQPQPRGWGHRSSLGAVSASPDRPNAFTSGATWLNPDTVRWSDGSTFNWSGGR